MTYRLISEPAAVREVLRRPVDFPPTNALSAVTPLHPRALRTLHKAGFTLPPVLASASGELHTRVRRVVAGFFTPAAIAATAPAILELSEQHVTQANRRLAAGPVDLAAAIAGPVPFAIMQELTGINCPSTLKQWSRDSLELFWGWPDAPRQMHLAHAAAEFYTWLRDRVEADRGSTNLFGALAAAGLTTPQICALGYFLLIASHETTAQLIATGLYRALTQPEHWAQLANPARARQFVRQLLATESSVPTWRRTAATDTQLAGQPIPARTELLLRLTGHHRANTEQSAYGLAFGYGIHRCLGAGLAELETTLIIQTTARHLDPVELYIPPPDWLRLLSFQTPRTVTVTKTEVAGR